MELTSERLPASLDVGRQGGEQGREQGGEQRGGAPATVAENRHGSSDERESVSLMEHLEQMGFTDTAYAEGVTEEGAA